MPIHHDAIIIISIQMLSSLILLLKIKVKMLFLKHLCNAHWNFFFSLVSNLPFVFISPVMLYDRGYKTWASGPKPCCCKFL